MNAVTPFTNCHIYRVEFPSGRVMYASTLQLAWDDADSLEREKGTVYLDATDAVVWSPNDIPPLGVNPDHRARVPVFWPSIFRQKPAEPRVAKRGFTV